MVDTCFYFFFKKLRRAGLSTRRAKETAGTLLRTTCERLHNYTKTAVKTIRNIHSKALHPTKYTRAHFEYNWALWVDS